LRSKYRTRFHKPERNRQKLSSCLTIGSGQTVFEGFQSFSSFPTDCVLLEIKNYLNHRIAWNFVP
jgi:hypothetical protein